jgi:hypothetical protein
VVQIIYYADFRYSRTRLRRRRRKSEGSKWKPDVKQPHRRRPRKNEEGGRKLNVSGGRKKTGGRRNESMQWPTEA